MSRKRSRPRSSSQTLRGAAPPKRQPQPWRWVLGVGIAVVAVAVLAIWQLQPDSPASPPASSAIGGVMECRGQPTFAARLGYADRLGISTSERTIAGLVIFDGRVSPAAPPEQRDIHQEPSWDDAGTLGPFVLDREGNIYTAPVPRTAISDVPADSQNTIYRVDRVSGELQPFLTLPDAPAASAENPFGILGLTYDCDSDALYASSVAGSNRRDERGRIVRIDLATKTVTEEVVGVDAIGLGVFRGSGGKRLYFGLARTPGLESVALDGQGHATGDIRSDIDLATLGASLGEQKIRRIRFDRQAMTLHIVPFNFNLRAVSEQQERIARYRYDGARDAWDYVE